MATITVSVLGHLGLAFLLWGVWQVSPGDPVPKGSMQGRFVVMALPTASEEPAVAQAESREERPIEPIRPTLASIAENPAPQPMPTPEPQLAQVKPRPQVEVGTVEEESPATAAAAVGTAAGQTLAADAETEALLQGIRGNWLEPPGVRRLFRCQVTVGFVGERVASVDVEETCSDAQLRDSIVRAVWKTSSLLGRHVQQQPLSFEFSP